MRRAILVALGTGAVITSAAALSMGHAPAETNVPGDEIGRERAHIAAREAHREAIETRYLAVRAQCDALKGIRRDDCLIAAHAFRGRALLQAQGPYERS